MDQLHRIEWEIKDGIGILTLNNPPENYLYEPEFIPLEALKLWISDISLKGILIHGKGRHFSAGGDLNRMFEMLSSGHEIDREMQAGNAVLQCLIDSDLPMIAAIQGVCFG
ncbi:MAG: enoyl-CoA hydratase/isomerase family protein, partial [bacterium]